MPRVAARELEQVLLEPAAVGNHCHNQALSLFNNETYPSPHGTWTESQELHSLTVPPLTTGPHCYSPPLKQKGRCVQEELGF